MKLDEDLVASARTVRRKMQGVIWGKDPNHYEGKTGLLKQLADTIKLVSTSTTQVISHPNIEWRGHQTPESWVKLLSESRFLLGLGSPLLGPSAIDAVSLGCVYINPLYDKPELDIHTSQHFFAKDKIGAPRVCSANLKNLTEVLECVHVAMVTELSPVVPQDFTWEAHLQRVRSIFMDN
jgi:hypothetical protein